MVALTVRLDDELYERVRAVAYRTRTPLNRLIAAALLTALPAMEAE